MSKKILEMYIKKTEEDLAIFSFKDYMNFIKLLMKFPDTKNSVVKKWLAKRWQLSKMERLSYPLSNLLIGFVKGSI